MICAGVFEFVCGAKPPTCSGRGYAGSTRGFHVDVAVTNVNGLLVRRGQRRDDLVYRGGVRFVGDAEPLAKDGLEFPLTKEMGDAFHGKIVWFVGEYGHLALALGQFVKQLSDALVRRRPHIPLARVGFLENRQAGGRFSVDVGILFADRPAKQIFYAAPDKLAIGIGFVRGEAPLGQRLIRGGRQVVQSIQQSPVEVEDDRGAIHNCLENWLSACD